MFRQQLLPDSVISLMASKTIVCFTAVVLYVVKRMHEIWEQSYKRSLLKGELLNQHPDDGCAHLRHLT